MIATIAIDFDGVIHAYRQGWHDGTIYDEPIPGAFDALRALLAEHPVAVFTAREVTSVASWLHQKTGIPVLADSGSRIGFWNERGALLVTNRKIAAFAYIDDRAIHFTDWPAALDELRRRTPEGATP
jgi:hypothetical protein